jgi:hemoglobin
MNTRSRLPLILLATLVVSACGGTAPDQGPRSLYDRLGGQGAIAAVVDDFVANVAGDARINGLFKNTDIGRLKAKLVEQICEATQGPCTYTGRDMKSTHQHLGIGEADFNALVEDLVKSLDRFKVAEADTNELLGLLGPMKSEIVTR